MIESFVPVEDITGHIFSGSSGIARRAIGINTHHITPQTACYHLSYPMLKVPEKCTETSKSVEKSKNLPRNGQYETADLSRKYKIIT